MPDEVATQKRQRAKQEARNAMEAIAKSGDKITYSDLTKLITVQRYAPNGTPLSDLLCAISRETHNQGRGLLSAVAINRQRRRPGPGFYALARGLDYEFDDEVEFWRAQLDKVHKIWGGQLGQLSGRVDVIRRYQARRPAAELSQLLRLGLRKLATATLEHRA